MRVIGIIPARAGSRRLVRKNLALLDGRPLITYTCEAALTSGVLDALYINTDSPEIAAVAGEAGAACPVLRPAALAADDTPTAAANRFLLQHLAQRGETYDTLITLQPTSPLRSAEDICEALALFEENAPCEVVSASPVAPAFWLGHAGRDGRFEALDGSDVLYRLNGAIYVQAVADILAERAAPRKMLYPMPANRGVDIDTAEDLAYAESLLHCHARCAGC